MSPGRHRYPGTGAPGAGNAAERALGPLLREGDLLLVLGEYIWEQQVIPPAEQWATGVRNVRELGKYAADLGVHIALELEPFWKEHGNLDITPRARKPEHTTIQEECPKRWTIQQAMLSPTTESDWILELEVDVTEPPADPDQPLIRLRRIGT